MINTHRNSIIVLSPVFPAHSPLTQNYGVELVFPVHKMLFSHKNGVSTIDLEMLRMCICLEACIGCPTWAASLLST